MGGTKLVIFHIGPVQEFIATARRSRDLWFGSWMLSELAKAAALKIVKINGGDIRCLVFPAPAGPEDLESEEFNVANKIVALIKQDPRELADAVYNAILERLHKLRDEAYCQVKGSFARDVAEKQVDDLIEFYWAASTLTGDSDYDLARKLAEAALSARKLTREFGPVSWGRSAPKCSLDGIRESVIPAKAHATEDERGENHDERLRRDYGVRRGEHLCGVCLLKRHGRREAKEHFLSTSHVAALPLLDRLQSKDVPLVKRYIEELKTLGILEDALGTVQPPHPVFGSNDGELLFEQRLREYFPEKEKFAKARQALRSFLKDACGEREPLPYYALLLADGDYMGKVIDAQKTCEAHRNLSSCQSRFAREAKKIVEKHNGSLVYSGGDDVLAFVPLHTVLDCARSLAETFGSLLRDFSVVQDNETITPTLSVGIAIAHHLAPLSDVIQLARDAERAAKSIKGKNALGITLSKRSGADRTVRGRWGELDRRLEWFAFLHQADALPDGAAYELRDLAMQFKDSQGETKSSENVKQVKEVLKFEVERIISRKRQRHGLEPIAGETLNKLLTEIRNALSDGEEPAQVIGQIADEIIIAREFAKAADLAGRSFPAEPSREVKPA
ncbi:MAG: type III-B CRISPR-associated protein Cas10/Cmr2 [Firmicutes bacterium]|nr:type III-B CRISPR-associated protein Cas10/Cmr2 [Candidatus Fermentithermobacillaceae bacterium]